MEGPEKEEGKGVGRAPWGGVPAVLCGAFLFAFRHLVCDGA